MMWLMNMPYIVVRAILGMSSGLIHICSYTSDMSNLDLYVAPAMSCHVVSGSRKGDTSLTVFLFCKWRSKTVFSLLLLLRTHGIRTACCTIVGTHQPAVVYWWILLAHSS